MATQKDIQSGLENLKGDMKKASEEIRDGAERSKNAIKDHPKAALGVALGATFAAGLIAGSQASRMKKRSKQSKAKAA